MTMTKTPYPSPALKGKYEVVLVEPGEVLFKGKTIDLRTIDLPTADKLANEKGFPYLKKIVPAPKPAQSIESDK